MSAALTLAAMKPGPSAPGTLEPKEDSMAQILDGKAHADRMLTEVAASVQSRRDKGLRPPCLAVVLV